MLLCREAFVFVVERMSENSHDDIERDGVVNLAHALWM
jgi:hypothetical protein